MIIGGVVLIPRKYIDVTTRPSPTELQIEPQLNCLHRTTALEGKGHLFSPIILFSEPTAILLPSIMCIAQRQALIWAHAYHPTSIEMP